MINDGKTPTEWYVLAGMSAFIALVMVGSLLVQFSWTGLGFAVAGAVGTPLCVQAGNRRKPTR
jgi:hypothetical protein